MIWNENQLIIRPIDLIVPTQMLSFIQMSVTSSEIHPPGL